jgi:carboxymethylenebutenolidase
MRDMDPNVQYLAEEIAENHADGMLTRREAMRRLAYLGLSAVSASALLAACGGDDDETETGAGSQASTTAAGGATATSAQTGPATVPPPAATENVTYPGKGITIQGVFGRASSPRGAVLVIHENQGITDFVRSMTGRLAASGYNALAVDLLSAQGGTASFTDPATIGPALTENATNRSVDDMKSSLEELQRRTPGAKLAAIGFCFGGGMVWELLKAGDPPPLAAALPFYGQANNPDFSRTKAAVLAVYAEQDARVNANRETAVSALQRAGLTHEARTFPGVPHAFMRNLDNPNAGDPHTQATSAYQAMIDWFGRHLR